MARTRIVHEYDNQCFIEIPEDGGEIARTEYWAPSSGGYVRNVSRHPGTSGYQVCDRLCYTGNTLYWNGSVPLVGLIRREYQAARRHERRMNLS